MGWLFAVALGLHRGHRGAVLQALIPLALGHAGAILLTVAVVGGVGWLIPERLLAWLAGLLLIGWGVYHGLRSPRHHFRIGLRAGFAGLALWSMLMGLAHGAGLMLVPVFAAWPGGGSPGQGAVAGAGAALAVIGIGVHILAMIAVTGLVAIVVHEWIGLGMLRRGWVNLDWIWSAALVLAGVILIAL